MTKVLDRQMPSWADWSVRGAGPPVAFLGNDRGGPAHFPDALSTAVLRDSPRGECMQVCNRFACANSQILIKCMLDITKICNCLDCVKLASIPISFMLDIKVKTILMQARRCVLQDMLVGVRDRCWPPSLPQFNDRYPQWFQTSSQSLQS